MIDNYVCLRPGHYFQMFKTGPSPDYGKKYIDVRYNAYTTTRSISQLRYDRIRKVVGEFKTICDFGYGNGDFLSYCLTQGHNCSGYDIADYPPPIGTRHINNVDNFEFDVITFFDSIEHLPESDLVSFLLAKRVKYVCVSVPHFHEELGPDWFKTWKHRRPNEHFHHFDIPGLTGLLEESNFTILYTGNDEDVIRTPVDSNTNILTVIAKKIQL